MTKWLITGANGNLGRNLISALLADAEGDDEIVAVVRSERAAGTIVKAVGEPLPDRLTIKQLLYTDVEALREACRGAERVVHLVGILKEGGGATYEEAHEASVEALVAALAGADAHFTYLSIVGSTPTSSNACLASKGRAEALLRAGEMPSCVLRVPMVLGAGDYASFALASRAKKSSSTGFRMESLEQPIYADDVVRAIRQAATLRVDAALDLGGPEVLTRAALTERAAAALGNKTRVRSLPRGLGFALAGLLGLLPNPPVTRAMLEVLDHDDDVDSKVALEALQMEGLTPLDETLRAVLS